MKINQRVHIIPVGDDQVERIVIPAQIGKADKIYLCTKKGKDIYKDVYKSSKNRIISENIVSSKDLIEVKYDIFNYSEIVEVFAKIISKEKRMNNTIYINISTGGNLVSAAAILACMMFDAEPYFCKMDDLMKKIPKNPDILPLPKYNIKPPDKELISFLYEIKILIKRKKINQIKKSECLAIMKKLHPNETFSNTSGDYNKLKYRYLNNLFESKYIDIEKKPRGKIRLTDDGRFALRIFSAFYCITEIMED